MKKLKLKKEVIVDLSNSEMNNLRGGFNSEAVIKPEGPPVEADPFATEQCNNNDCIGSAVCGGSGDSRRCEPIKDFRTELSGCCPAQTDLTIITDCPSMKNCTTDQTIETMWRCMP